jgi:hypothetical protein
MEQYFVNVSKTKKQDHTIMLTIVIYLLKYRIMVVHNDELVMHVFQIAPYVLNNLESVFKSCNSD